MTRHSEFPQIFLLMNSKAKPLKGERSFWLLFSKSLSKSATVSFRITRSVSENENEFKSQRKKLFVSQPSILEWGDGWDLFGRSFSNKPVFLCQSFYRCRKSFGQGVCKWNFPRKVLFANVFFLVGEEEGGGGSGLSPPSLFVFYKGNFRKNSTN